MGKEFGGFLGENPWFLGGFGRHMTGILNIEQGILNFEGLIRDKGIWILDTGSISMRVSWSYRLK